MLVLLEWLAKRKHRKRDADGTYCLRKRSQTSEDCHATSFFAAAPLCYLRMAIKKDRDFFCSSQTPKRQTKAFFVSDVTFPLASTSHSQKMSHSVFPKCMKFEIRAVLKTNWRNIAYFQGGEEATQNKINFGMMKKRVEFQNSRLVT